MSKKRGSRIGRRIIFGQGAIVERGAFAPYRASRSIPDRILRIGAGSLIRCGSILYEGSIIGERFETGHGTVIREENQIGNECRVWSHSIVDYGCRISNRVRIHSNVYICQYSIIEDDVFVGPGTVFLNSPHPGCDYERQCMRGPRIMKGAKIGGGCVIFPFVTVGSGAVVGAGSIVTKDVPPGRVVYGSPARGRGRSRALRCLTGHTRRPYPEGK